MVSSTYHICELYFCNTSICFWIGYYLDMRRSRTNWGSSWSEFLDPPLVKCIFCPPPLALAPLIHGWCLSLTGFLVFRCWYWQQETINFKWWMEFNALSKSGGPLSLDSTLLLPRQRLMSTDGFRSLDSQQYATRDRTHCSVADCQNPTACASKRCLHCQHFYCATCASLSHTCPKSPSEHRFVSSLLTTRGREQPRTRSKVEKRKLKKEEGPPWECKQCTMINRPQVLVCLGCDGNQSTRRWTNSPTPTRRRIKSSRNVGELVVDPIQLIRS